MLITGIIIVTIVVMPIVLACTFHTMLRIVIEAIKRDNRNIEVNTEVSTEANAK